QWFGIGPTDPRFTTDLSLNRPTYADDIPWRATRRWTDDEQANFRQFVGAYTRARLDTGERVDCADLALETLVVYARQRGLPIKLTNGSMTITNSSGPRPVAATVRNEFVAVNIPMNT